MPVELFANNAQTTLNGGITAGATSLIVTSATNFPSASSTATPASQFRIRVEDAPAGSAVNLEFMRVTDVSGTTFTVARGQEGTSGVIHANGSVVTLVATAGALTNFPANVSTPGTLAARPAASAVPNGFLYFANDDNGGTVYRSDGASTWTKVAPGVLETSGVELGYAEITSNFTSGGVANTIYAVTGLTTTVTVGSRPVRIDGLLQAVLPSASTTTVSALIYEDGSFVGGISSVGSATANKRLGMTPWLRRAPAAGSHTYDIRVKSDITATLTVESGVGFPSAIQVREV